MSENLWGVPFRKTGTVFIFSIILGITLLFGNGFVLNARAADGGVQGIAITDAEITGKPPYVEGTTECVYDDTAVSLYFGELTRPGDYVNAGVTVTNYNDFDVAITDKSYTVSLSDALYVTVSTAEETESIKAGESVVFTICLAWDSDYEGNLEDEYVGFSFVLHYEDDEVSLETVMSSSDEAESSSSTGSSSSGSSSSSSTGSSSSGSSSSSSGSSSSSVTSVQTGDRSDMLCWMILIIASICMLAAALGYARSKKSKMG